jgi:REP element-mobilizing transposase RayT
MSHRGGHHRRSIRLSGYDYARGGAYFVTICTAARKCLLGEVTNGGVALSPFGEIVWLEWQRSADVRPTLKLGPFVVMPNHVHGIVALGPGAERSGERDVGAHSCAPLQRRLFRPPRSIGSFVAQLKASTARRINALRQTPGAPVWQRNYYEHIVRDEDDYVRISEYIENNPLGWPEDEYHVS